MNSSRFTAFAFGALAAAGVFALVAPAPASAALDLQSQVAALHARVAVLEAAVNGGEITVERINVHQIAARDIGDDPDEPVLIITDALDRVVIGVNGAPWDVARLGFFGVEPHPQPKYNTTTPSTLNVAYSVAATGLTASP